ncbi:MAG: hypothetical protein IJ111_13040 [Eggerthellaceae bacterium]|nr:hypothetical protein [Eggerthellaceae bacterium]
MGFFKYMFGDNRVLTAKDPAVQRELTYMNDRYQAFIEEFPASRRETVYFIRCTSKRLFSRLYRDGVIDGGSIRVPGKSKVYNTKADAFEGLMWLRCYLDDMELKQDIDDRFF